MCHRFQLGRWRFCLNPSADTSFIQTEYKYYIMDELFNILSDGKAHVKVEMNAKDLKAFSDELIRRAKDELGSMVEAARKERMLSKTEVKELFGVCDATLWHWANKGILKPVKTGNKVLYPEYEVRKALGQRHVNF